MAGLQYKGIKARILLSLGFGGGGQEGVWLDRRQMLVLDITRCYIGVTTYAYIVHHR